MERVGREGDRHARVVFWVAEIGYQHCRRALSVPPLSIFPLSSSPPTRARISLLHSLQVAGGFPLSAPSRDLVMSHRSVQRNVFLKCFGIRKGSLLASKHLALRRIYL